MSGVSSSAVEVANRSAGRRPKFSLRTLFVLLTILCIWFGYPFLRANWLLHKLNTANTVPEAIALVNQILADNTSIRDTYWPSTQPNPRFVNLTADIPYF
jgi:hypothetical protein